MTKVKTWVKEHKTMVIGAVSLATCCGVGYVFGSYGTFKPVEQRRIKDFVAHVGEAAKGATAYTIGTAEEFAKLAGKNTIQAGLMFFGNEVNTQGELERGPNKASFFYPSLSFA